jgi:hypothetical protein
LRLPSGAGDRRKLTLANGVFGSELSMGLRLEIQHSQIRPMANPEKRIRYQIFIDEQQPLAFCFETIAFE